MAQALQPVEGISVQGPVPALVSRVRTLYIQEVWIKCTRDNRVLENVKQLIREQRSILTSEKGTTSLQILIDIDPLG